MGDVTAVGMDTVTEKSGHQVTGMAVSVCITPAAPSPLPLPYPTMGTVAEGIVDEPLRTKINGAKHATVGSCVKVCHGNEPGTLKEVLSLNTSGPSFLTLGAPTVLCELGMMGITGSLVQMNKAITVGMSGTASDASGEPASSGGGGGPGGSSTSPTGTSAGGGDGTSNDQAHAGASVSPVPVTPDHEAKAHLLSDPKRGIRVRPETVALAEHANLSHPPSKDQVSARKTVASAFMRKHGQTLKSKDEDGKPYGQDKTGKPIKKARPLSHDERKSELECTNYNEPVKVGPPPPCRSPQYQYQSKGNDRGSYFAANKNTTPSQLGIGDKGKAWNEPGQPVVDKTQKIHEVDPNSPHMVSTASEPPKGDFWSVPGSPQPCTGGGEQTYIPSGCDPSSGLVN